MDAFRIQGGPRLAGRISIEGSKNSSLPLMAAALLADEPVTLRQVPDLVDIANMRKLLAELGCDIQGEHGTVSIANADTNRTHARYDIVRTMRASICVLGPLLARRRHARVSMPGGCAFGARPVDLHLRGLAALGAKIHLDGGDIVASLPPGERLKGATIFLGGAFGSTVLGTANVMSAATLAEGTTVIESAACEPEIADLATMLNAMGAKISGAGSPRVVIEGVEELGGVDHTVIPDRIVAGTYAVAAAITNGDVILDGFPYDSLLAVIDTLESIGVEIKRINTTQNSNSCSVQVTCSRHLNPTVFTTQPYPGFPTDLQAQVMSLLCLANGNSIITEKIYPERFMHVAELARMGAQIFRQGPTVVVQGVRQLIGAPVMASDLRGSASLVLAGLAAEGETVVSRVYHLDRGYVAMEKSLQALGAKIERFNADAEVAALPAPTKASPPRVKA
ncbi:MAG TPA: UDP-N-acetylglucosamine 1-carboxyvinyltransferase [Phycisphaerales bacterium]|nr:UDP-N-acetylglucosamine 1-carboxyvinyltransferase [Phycisphaerales bacterium]HRQ76560.1 UDP-N-acetylglucosamine 1-carboxyvinyltransferase [Phycisphaerales bacterium]